MSQPTRKNDQETVLRRLKAMGLDTRLMRGGRCVLASMELRSTEFADLGGPRTVRRVLFVTVGIDRIKCLRPRCLFQLPMIRILDCASPSAIEARIREAWKNHAQKLRDNERWLEDLGAETRFAVNESLLMYPIEGEDDTTVAAITDDRQLVLPGAGRLTGVSLERYEDRVLRVDPGISSSVELSIGISTQLERLADASARSDVKRRHVAMLHTPPIGPVASADEPSHNVLMVGPQLTRHLSYLESLRLRGYRVVTAKSEREALEAFDASSFELVMTDMNLGRSEGLDLLMSISRIHGVENVPVILVDAKNRPAKRHAARSLGAAGYLTYPLDVPRIAGRLAQLVNEPGRRRFTRYSNRLALRIPGTTQTGVLTALSRGGMFVSTEGNFPPHTLHDFELLIPDLGRSLKVKAEPIYQMAGLGEGLSGVGMRFHSFAESHEAVLLEFLRTIEES